MLREPHATKGSGVTPSRVRYRRAMDPKKPWDGYVSFSYLQPGTDFTVFELDEQVGRIQPFTYPLDIHQAERADRLLRSCVCISLHDHAGVSPKDWNRFDAYVREGREWYGFEGLAASGLDAVLENFLDGTSTITSKSGWKWTDVVHDIGMRFADVAHQSVVFVGSTVDDIVQAHASGRIALIPCLEGAAPIENELDRLDVLFGLGVRMLGITYSESNALGGGLKDPGDAGLTRFGRDAVRRMNRLGMAIDLSHVGDVTAMDTCGSSERPVFLSHSGARALFPERKLKSDDLLARSPIPEESSASKRLRTPRSPRTILATPWNRSWTMWSTASIWWASITSGWVPTRSSVIMSRCIASTRRRSIPARFRGSRRSTTWRVSRTPASSPTSSGGSWDTATTTSRSARSLAAMPCGPCVRSGSRPDPSNATRAG